MGSNITVKIFQDKCTGCGLCANDCPRYVLEMRDGKAILLDDDCLKCGHCFAICPENAILLEGIEDNILEKGNSAKVVDADSLKAHLKLRRSVRQYQNKPVERIKLEKTIEAGRLAPTGNNLQNVRYVVIQNGIDELEDKIIEQYKALGKQQGVLDSTDISKHKFKRGFLFHGAPALILVISENHTNACLASMGMELMAEALGLGALYVGLFSRPANQNEIIRKSFDLTKKENIVICLALGYPAVTYRRSAPKKPANIIWR